jgi:hypothetical protein
MQTDRTKYAVLSQRADWRVQGWKISKIKISAEAGRRLKQRCTSKPASTSKIRNEGSISSEFLCPL